MRPVPDDRRHITADEAEEQLGIPSGTIRGWASQEKLFPVSIAPDRTRWYLLSDVLALAGKKPGRQRAAHTRPTRRRKDAPADIA